MMLPHDSIRNEHQPTKSNNYQSNGNNCEDDVDLIRNTFPIVINLSIGFRIDTGVFREVRVHAVQLRQDGEDGHDR